MKKILLPAAFIALTACNNQKPEPKVEEHTTVIEHPVKEKEPDGTTLKINDEGVTYTNKEGDNKSDVRIGDSTSVIIKN